MANEPTQFPVDTPNAAQTVYLPPGKHTLELVITDVEGEKSPPDTLVIDVVQIKKLTPRKGFSPGYEYEGHIDGMNLNAITQLHFERDGQVVESIEINYHDTGTDKRLPVTIKIGQFEFGDLDAVDLRLGVTTETGVALTPDPIFIVEKAPPVIEAIEPDQGDLEQTLEAVVISGAHFRGEVAVDFGPDIDAEITSVSQTHETIELKLTIGAAADLGERPFKVTAEGGTTESGDVLFEVVDPELPVILDINPPERKQGAKNMKVTISGENFIGGEDEIKVDFGSGIEVVDLTKENDQKLHLKISIDENAAKGERPVTVTTEKGTATGVFTVLDSGKPRISGIDPDEAFQGGERNVTISGENLIAVTDVDFGQGIMVEIVEAQENAIRLILKIDRTADLGKRSFKVTTPEGTAVSEEIFTVKKLVPQIDSLDIEGWPKNRIGEEGTLVVIGEHLCSDIDVKLQGKNPQGDIWLEDDYVEVTGWSSVGDDCNELVINLKRIGITTEDTQYDRLVIVSYGDDKDDEEFDVPFPGHPLRVLAFAQALGYLGQPVATTVTGTELGAVSQIRLETPDGSESFEINIPDPDLVTDEELPVEFSIPPTAAPGPRMLHITTTDGEEIFFDEPFFTIVCTPVDKLKGIGQVSKEKLAENDITCLEDLVEMSPEDLANVLTISVERATNFIEETRLLLAA